MKKLFLSLFAFVMCNWIHAQHLVSIPDSAFRQQLKNQFPQFFVGNQLDTMAASTNISQMIVSGLEIHSLEGIQYFKSIQSLSVVGTNIQGIPNLNRQYIRHIQLVYNLQLSSTPLLPDSTVTLGLYHNTSLRLISNLPTGLKHLTLYNLDISNLPKLPQYLEFFSSYSNPNLKCLGELPTNLSYLDTDVQCISNKPVNLIGNFPRICNPTLDTNHCGTTQKPVISGYLYIDINSNGYFDSVDSKVTSSSVLVQPGNRTLYPDTSGRYYFEADTNIIYSLTASSLTGYQSPATAQLTILGLNSSFQVNFGYTNNPTPFIYGTVYQDVNGNQQIDGSDLPRPHRKIRVQPGNTLLTTDDNGRFLFGADSVNQYRVIFDEDTTQFVILNHLKGYSRTMVNFLIPQGTGYLIPDTAFRNQLKHQFTNCFVGELLDTTYAAVVGNPFRWSLDIEGDSIKSIEGIKYFKSITRITIVQTSITSIPVLPKSLVDLSLSYNNLLETIHILPESLNSFSAFYNPRLNFVQLSDFPNRLTNLYCFNNNISHFPQLPRGLKYFNCSKNSLISLPNIPDSLVSFDCSINQLTSITGLTSPKLKTVNFSSNNISECPAFGKNLYEINCTQNPFTCLKTLPDSLVYLQTDVKCIPNIPNRLATILSSTTGARLVLCNPSNNPYNCQVNPTVQGKVFYDLNNNQTFDQGDVLAVNQKINLAPKGSFAFTDSVGNYIIDLDTDSRYVLSLATIPYFVSSPSVTVIGIGLNLSSTVNFYYTKTADVKDISVVLTPFQAAARPGFPFTMDVTVRNNGTIPSTAQVAFQLPSAYSVSGIIFHNCSTTSANIPCSLGTLLPGQSIRGFVEGRIRPTATLGDSISFVAKVNGSEASDVVPSNNVSLANFIIRGSYDPNDKAGTSLDPSKAGQSQWIDYTIRFQNTGTDTAFTVVVADSLPSELIASTLEILSTSHAYEFSKTGNTVYFRFNNILLADSNTNEKASHGFIKFRIKALANLPLSASIWNRAAIYFDYNAPVITDYAISSFISPARVTVIATAEQSQAATYVYPNPVINGRLYVHTNLDQPFQLFNSSGLVVAKGTIEDNGIDVSSLPAGIYLLHMGNHREKVVIE